MRFLPDDAPEIGQEVCFYLSDLQRMTGVYEGMVEKDKLYGQFRHEGRVMYSNYWDEVEE